MYGMEEVTLVATFFVKMGFMALSLVLVGLAVFLALLDMAKTAERSRAKMHERLRKEAMDGARYRAEHLRARAENGPLGQMVGRIESEGEGYDTEPDNYAFGDDTEEEG